MIELKAELMKKKREYEEAKKNKINLINKSKLGSQEKAKISEISQIEEDQLKKSREALVAKSRLYSQLESGKLMETDLNVSQRENLMVDFAWKGWNPETEDFDFDERKDDEDEDEKFYSNKTLKIDQITEMLNNRNVDDNDKWVEYEDEFGRTRVCKLSQLRRIQSERQEVQRSLVDRYDGDHEIRNKGVGFYQFSRDEEGRQRQMKELKKLREETMERRTRNLILKEERRIRIENRLTRLKCRISKQQQQQE